MRMADALKASWTTLTHAMQTDTRFTILERDHLTRINTQLDAGAVSTSRADDMFVVHCLKRFCDEPENYAPV